MKIEKLTMSGSPAICIEQGEIIAFEVNGEMAPVTWYRQDRPDGSIVEVNGKFVERIDYK